MASKFEINIGSKYSDLKQRVQAAKSMTGKVGAGTADGLLHGKGLFRSLEQAVKDLTKATQDQTKATRVSGRGTGGGSGRSTTSAGMDTYGDSPKDGLKAIGKSLPWIGGFFAAAGVLATQMNKIGKAYLDRIEQQVGTAGIGGIQSKGLGGYYDAAQAGDLSKSWRMSAGRYKVGGKFGSAIDYGKLYGIGAGEIGQQLGLFGRFGGNGGGKFSAITGMAGARGIETELPILLKGIASEMEDAVRRGVNASDLPENMARSVTNFVGANNGQVGVEAALKQYKDYHAASKAMSEGRVEGLDQTRRLLSGRKAVKEYMGMDPKNKDYTFFGDTIKSLGISQDDLKGMSVKDQDTLAMALAARGDPLTQQLYEKSINDTFGGGGKGNPLSRLTSMRLAKQGMNAYTGDSDIFSIAAYSKYLDQGGITNKAAVRDMDRFNKSMSDMYSFNAGVAGKFRQQKIDQEMLLLEKVGETLGETVLKLNESLLSLGNQINDLTKKNGGKKGIPMPDSNFE